MKQIKINSDGKTYLHIWRTGTQFDNPEKMQYFTGWNNVQFSFLPSLPTRRYSKVDLRKPLPYADKSFDVIYANHVLEHLDCNEAKRFLADLRRITKPTGRVRVVVPDLEFKCREYLASLERTLTNTTESNLQTYRWNVMELIDQMVRLVPAGEMGKALLNGDFNEQQVTKTAGDVFQHLYPSNNYKRQNLFSTIRSMSWRQVLDKTLTRLAIALYGNDPRRFRETNRWMYDRLSLQVALRNAGFTDVQAMNFNESKIDNWAEYQFDSSTIGNYPFEPSCYVEAVAPTLKLNVTHKVTASEQAV